MREGFGRFAYCLRGAARVVALVLAFCLIAVFCTGRSKADAETVRGRAAEIVSRDLIVPGNNTSVEEPEPAKEKEAKPTEEPEAEPTPKPNKQLTAEQFALGVILAGGIAIGMMIALFFYYMKQNSGHKE